MNNQVIVARLEKLQWKLRQAHALVCGLLEANGHVGIKHCQEQLPRWYH